MDAALILGRGELLVYDSIEALQKSVDSSCRVRVGGSIGSLCAALEANGCQVEGVSHDEACVRGEGDLVQAVLEASEACGAVIREITPSRNSLEDIFLEAVRATEGKPVADRN